MGKTIDDNNSMEIIESEMLVFNVMSPFIENVGWIFDLEYFEKFCPRSSEVLVRSSYGIIYVRKTLMSRINLCVTVL